MFKIYIEKYELRIILGNVNYKLFIDAVASAMSNIMLHEYVQFRVSYWKCY